MNTFTNHSIVEPGLLNISTIDMLSWIILVEDYPDHNRTLSIIPGLYLLESSSTHPKL